MVGAGRRQREWNWRISGVIMGIWPFLSTQWGTIVEFAASWGLHFRKVAPAASWKTDKSSPRKKERKWENDFGSSAEDTQNGHLFLLGNSLFPPPTSTPPTFISSTLVRSFVNLGWLRTIFLLSGILLLRFHYLTPFLLLGFSLNVTFPEKPLLTFHIRIHSPVIHKNRTLYFSVRMITPRISA